MSLATASTPLAFVASNGSAPSYYASFVAVLAVLVFFTGISNYAFTVGLLSFPPLYFVLALLVFTIPLAVTREGVRALLTSRLMLWMVADLSVAATSFLWSSQSPVAQQALRLRFLIGLFAYTLVVLFYRRIARYHARLAVLTCTWLAIGLNYYELFNPGSIGFLFGRSAGLYINPNVAASAILLGMVISIDVIRPSRRPALVLLSGIGVFLTLSRGALLCWGVIVAATLIQRQMRFRQLMATFLVVVLVGAPTVLFSGQLARVTEALSFINSRSQGFRRVLEAQEVIAAGDFSTEERADVARRGIALLLERPLTGFGIGYTLEWEARVSTHNIFLRYGAESGIPGVLVALLLIVMIRWRAAPAARPLATNMLLFLLVWGMFSHNVFEEWHMILGIALCFAEIDQAGYAVPPSPYFAQLSDTPAATLSIV
jgi:O-antigen ligase